MKKTIHILIVSMIACFAAFAAETPKKVDLYEAGHFVMAPFASYRVHEFGDFNGKFGAGLSAGYGITRNLTVEAWALGEEYTHGEPAIDSLLEAGAYLKFYAPIKGSGFAPYAILGYSRNLQSERDGGTAKSKPDECSDKPAVSRSSSRQASANNMDAGIGLEYRFTKNVTAFVDGVWVQDFGLSDPVSFAHAKFRGGLGWRF